MRRALFLFALTAGLSGCVSRNDGSERRDAQPTSDAQSAGSPDSGALSRDAAAGQEDAAVAMDAAAADEDAGAGPCEGTSCSGHGTCSVTGGTPACQCARGFHAVGLECIADLPAHLLAFPGCEGSGCETRAGLDTSAGSPRVFRVTSLSDGTGPGTLRDCLEASGPRTCVFAVAGNIHTTGFSVTNPYVTVRCDTAPGMGIELDDDERVLSSPGGEHAIFWVRTHDVVVRGCRMRAGGDPSDDAHAVIVLMGGRNDVIHHVVLDHNSTTWGRDETTDIYGWLGGGAFPLEGNPHDVQLGYNIIAEGVHKTTSPTGRGSLIAGGSGALVNWMKNIDVHHNLYASNALRNPLVGVFNCRLVNNIIFNWGAYPAALTGGMVVDAVGNLGKPGPMTNNSRHGYLGMCRCDGPDNCPTASPYPSVYLSGNKLAGNDAELGWTTDLDDDGAPDVLFNDNDECTPAFVSEKRTAPQAAPGTGPEIAAVDASQLARMLLGPGGVGASRRLDCGGRWVVAGVRDPVDQRIVSSYDNPSGAPAASFASPSEVGGFPVIAPIAASPTCPSTSRDNASCACADQDEDGIPDYWERAFCGSATGCDPLGTGATAPWTALDAFLSGELEAP